MTSDSGINFHEFKKEVLEDYRIGHLSRNLSLLGRKEVLNGKAKFGIFGDGKEVAQLAMAKQFKNGDWHSGYYLDQTFMLAVGMTTPEEFFTSLYGGTDTNYTSSNISTNARQMPRLLGLAYASRLYRNNPALKNTATFNNNGNEVAFGSIGDVGALEESFFETMIAAAAHQIPMAVSVWYDGYNVSGLKSLQTAKKSIPDLLKGFEKGPKDKTGILIYKLKGWDYAGLCQAYQEAIARCRKESTPVLFYMDEATQPHSYCASKIDGGHKSAEHLQWEKDFDCLVKMKEWMIERSIATAEDCEEIEKGAFIEAQEAQEKAWQQLIAPLNMELNGLITLVESKPYNCTGTGEEQIKKFISHLKSIQVVHRNEILSTARKILHLISNYCQNELSLKHPLQKWVADYKAKTCLLNYEDDFSALQVPILLPQYGSNSIEVDGRDILRDNFDALFSKIPELLILGKDISVLGGVNPSLEGLQKKHGTQRICEVATQENTMIGVGLGLALRGFRPIAQIQNFDELAYGFHTMSNDITAQSHRTKTGQKAPLIIRTRSHRIESNGQSAAPTGILINSIRGLYICVPRDMTRAAGMYNTLLQANESGLVIEPANEYNIHEPRPENMGEFTVPLGIPEVLREGHDITLISYGACISVAREAVQQLHERGISVELIDVQTLLPFDTTGLILESLKKTNRVVFFDEDLPGGTTAFMMQQVLEKQGGFQHLDSDPRSVTAKDSFDANADNFSNPSTEDVYETIYQIMNEFNPQKYPPLY